MFRVIDNESGIKLYSCAILIIINLVSLYFIISLFSYGEIRGYIPDRAAFCQSLRQMGWLLYCTMLSNISFIAIVLMILLFEGKSGQKK